MIISSQPFPQARGYLAEQTLFVVLRNQASAHVYQVGLEATQGPTRRLGLLSHDSEEILCFTVVTPRSLVTHHHCGSVILDEVKSLCNLWIIQCLAQMLDAFCVCLDGLIQEFEVGPVKSRVVEIYLWTSQ